MKRCSLSVFPSAATLKAHVEGLCRYAAPWRIGVSWSETSDDLWTDARARFRSSANASEMPVFSEDPVAPPESRGISGK